MKLGYYPGCSLKGTSIEYKESVRAVCKAFDIQLVEIPDWNCCGATAAHNMNKELSLSLPARILALAEREGLTDIVVPCAACYNRLTVVQHELNEHKNYRDRVKEIIEMDFKGTTNVLNVVQLIQKYMIDKLQYKLVKPFNYKAACYYGCLLVRPHNILNFDRVEDPQSMDEIIRQIGGTPIDWEYKVECCGAGMSVSRTDLVSKLSGKIIKDADDRGAECFIVACPMCHSNLDMRRPDINKYLDKNVDSPVLYIIQALGLAIGLSEKELGLQRHFVPVNLPERPKSIETFDPMLATQSKEE
jgi:heterodisulfide reductase subunit B